ncbi:MAG: flagellar basal body rod protein FlgF [Proteobacteria bacterium]|nr:MAG: flagellar basal body rod protein FlgF [Pseudomonadota bacterium]
MDRLLYVAMSGAKETLRAQASNNHNLANASTTGALQQTGRDLDVAVHGDGFIAVQGLDGREAYTRAGDLRIEPDGTLRTGTGLQVMGDGGPVSVPPANSVTIGSDGSVSVVPLGQGPETRAVVGRIKLVKPEPTQLDRGADGLFRLRDGSDAPADASVSLAQGALESSNVNVADAMVTMIELARRFDLQVKAMRSAEDNGAAAAKLLSVS